MWGVTQVTCIASVSAFDCTSFGLSAVSSSCISVTAFPAASSCVSPLSYLSGQMEGQRIAPNCARIAPESRAAYRFRSWPISRRFCARSVWNVWISSR